MSTEELREYLHQAYKLEKRLYQQKSLFNETQEQFRPRLPAFENYGEILSIPSKPIQTLKSEIKIPNFNKNEAKSSSIKITTPISIVLSLLFTIMFCAFKESHSVDYISPVAMFPIVTAVLITIFSLAIYSNKKASAELKAKDIKKKNDIIQSKNQIARQENDARQKEINRINAINEQTKNENNLKEARNAKAKATFDRETENYQKVLSDMESAIASTRTTLDALYQKNVLFKKYQQEEFSFVAVSSFYEYFASGRCTELEGPNGAYNIFEAEIRQDMIIGVLSDILENLSQIKRNQYMIYTAIQEGNEATRQLLSAVDQSIHVQNYIGQQMDTALNAQRSMERTLSLTNYYSSITAANTETLKWLDNFHPSFR